MRKVGCFVGKFLPPHIGHLSVIDRALNECERVIVVLAENPQRSKKECKRTLFPYFSPKKRIKWFKKHYKDEKNIKFVYLDESGLKAFPEGLKEWSERFRQVVKEKIDAKYADESYRELNEKYFPECEFVPIDREKIAVHGKDIRSNEDFLKYAIPEGIEEIKQELNKIKKEKNYE